MNSIELEVQSKKESDFSQMLRAFFQEDAEICTNCGNIYRIVWLKEGDDYNAFGFKHCPFCGLLMDEPAHMGSG